MSGSDFMKVDTKKIPSQLDICFSEKCNLDCDYCFVNKTCSESLNFEEVKRGIDAFFLLEGKDKTVTFTTSEPFIYPQLFKRTINYILKEAKKKDLNISIIATTNGVLFNSEMRKFISLLDSEIFTLNFSLDGMSKSHDAHRKTKRGEPSFAKAMKNMKEYSLKHLVRVITTVTPSEISSLERNIEYIFSLGFRNIDIFPQMFTIWNDDCLRKLKNGLSEIAKRANKGEFKDNNIRLLNRLWGDTYYGKILLGSDANFYLSECLLPLKYTNRTPYIIGKNDNLNLTKRNAIFDLIFARIRNKHNNKCALCRYQKFCADPIPLYLWSMHEGKDFKLYFSNFCKISEIMIESSAMMKNKNVLDKKQWNKN